MNILSLFKVKAGQEEADRKRISDFRAVFATEAGRRVLCYLLADMHFFSEIVASEEERVLQNYARRLLAYCGAWRGQNVPRIVDALMGLPWQTETEKERSAEE